MLQSMNHASQNNKTCIVVNQYLCFPLTKIEKIVKKKPCDSINNKGHKVGSMQCLYFINVCIYTNKQLKRILIKDFYSETMIIKRKTQIGEDT